MIMWLHCISGMSHYILRKVKCSKYSIFAVVNIALLLVALYSGFINTAALKGIFKVLKVEKAQTGHKA